MLLPLWVFVSRSEEQLLQKNMIPESFNIHFKDNRFCSEQLEVWSEITEQLSREREDSYNSAPSQQDEELLYN